MIHFLNIFRFFFFYLYGDHRDLHSFPTRRSSDLHRVEVEMLDPVGHPLARGEPQLVRVKPQHVAADLAEAVRSEEHTSELQSRQYLVCRLLLEKKKNRSSRIVPFRTSHEAAVGLT